MGCVLSTVGQTVVVQEIMICGACLLVSCFLWAVPLQFESWVKGHAKDSDMAMGRTTSEDKIGNDGADKLAAAGAAAHHVPSEVVEAAKDRCRDATQTHKMMLAIMSARQAQEEESECDADRGSDMGGCQDLD